MHRIHLNKIGSGVSARSLLICFKIPVLISYLSICVCFYSHYQLSSKDFSLIWKWRISLSGDLVYVCVYTGDTKRKDICKPYCWTFQLCGSKPNKATFLCSKSNFLLRILTLYKHQAAWQILGGWTAGHNILLESGLIRQPLNRSGRLLHGYLYLCLNCETAQIWNGSTFWVRGVHEGILLLHAKTLCVP